MAGASPVTGEEGGNAELMMVSFWGPGEESRGVMKPQGSFLSDSRQGSESLRAKVMHFIFFPLNSYGLFL